MTILTGTRKTTYEDYFKGTPRKITDAQGNITLNTVDNLGRVVKTKLPDGGTISYGFDADNNLVSVTPDKGTEHRIYYNVMGDISSYEPPLNWYVADGGQTTYRYDKDRNLLNVTYPGKEAIDYFRDANKGQLTKVVHSRGEEVISYFEKSSKVKELRNYRNVKLGYSYDGTRITQEKTTTAENLSFEVNFEHNKNMWPTQYALDDSNVVDYQYDNDGLVTGAGEESLVRNASTGFLESVNLDSTHEAFTYNNYGELASSSVSHSGEALFSYNLERDALGRITKKTEVLSGTAKVYEYKYTQRGELSEVWTDGVKTESYNYDGNGNRAEGITTIQDQLLNYRGYNYTYGPNGELKTQQSMSGTRTFDYDVFGNLLKVELENANVIEYLTDAKNRRIGKKVNGVIQSYYAYKDQLTPIAELNADGTVKSLFLYGSKPNIPDYMIKNGIKYKIVSDHLGSVRMVLNASTGEIVQSMTYSSFGEVKEDTNPGFTPFGFAGGLYDSDTGLVRFGARDYDAFTGRWTAKDPIRFNGGDTNLYRYVGNDPVNRIDSSGLFSMAEILVGGAVIGIIAYKIYRWKNDHGPADIVANSKALTEKNTPDNVTNAVWSEALIRTEQNQTLNNTGITDEQYRLMQEEKLQNEINKCQ